MFGKHLIFFSSDDDLSAIVDKLKPDYSPLSVNNQSTNTLRSSSLPLKEDLWSLSFNLASFFKYFVKNSAVLSFPTDDRSEASDFLIQSQQI